MDISAETKLGTNRHANYLQKALGLGLKSAKKFFEKPSSE
jgi:hypothetical protein